MYYNIRHCFLIYLNHISGSQTQDRYALTLCCNMTHKGVYNWKYQKNLIYKTLSLITQPCGMDFKDRKTISRDLNFQG